MTSETETRLFKVISDEFSIDPSEIDRDTVAADVDGWDSLRHVMVLAAIESEFGIRFGALEIAKIGRVGDILSLIDSKV